MQLIEELDKIPTTYLKKLKGSEIWEIRVIYKSNIFRILGFFVTEKLFVVTHGFKKKTQKTPKKEIDKAEKYRKSYYRDRYYE